ncbi:MAG: hypothetical protein IPI98_09010 [Chitinophagaceae bacterium]|nr:hypothetical protein [Chitinophagaceae bacterium]
MKGTRQKFGHTTAALIIGDRALNKLSSVPCVYDLAEAWQQTTGRPFVLPCGSNVQLPSAFIHRLMKQQEWV